MLRDHERLVLFWVFISFFTMIGVMSLLVVVGTINADPRFRKWAVSGFVVAVATAVFGLFKVTFEEQIPIMVTVYRADGEASPLKLVKGHYFYDEQTASGAIETKTGRVELSLGHSMDWNAKLPEDVLQRAIGLRFEDSAGALWEVDPFYPNHISRAMSPADSSAVAGPPGGSPAGSWGEAHAAGFGVASRRGGEAFPYARVVQTGTPPKFDNYSRSAWEYNDRMYYKWRVFVDEPNELLETISRVEYLLHPTFPQPFQVRTNPRNKFALETTGWGEFRILITVRYKDGRIRKTSYYLDLDKPWPEMDKQ